MTARLDESGVDLTDDDEHCAMRRTPRRAASATVTSSPTRVIATLKASYADQLEINRYSAQVFPLHRSPRGFYLRANLWPSERDAAYTASGPAAFSYGVPHDHNFSFLTTGYFGPGYVSDYYDYDAETVDGRLGEPLDLNPSSSAASARRGQDDALTALTATSTASSRPKASSVGASTSWTRASMLPWRDQYIVDLGQKTDGRGTIARRPTLTSGELLLRCAVHLTDNGRDVAEQFAKSHPIPRVRANAIGALAAAEGVGRKRCWNAECGIGTHASGMTARGG